MFEKPFTRALPAVVLGVCVAGAVEAYPTTTTTTTQSGRTSVTGTYRPLDLSLTTLYSTVTILDDGGDEITYKSGVTTDSPPSSYGANGKPILYSPSYGEPPYDTTYTVFTGVYGGTYSPTGTSRTLVDGTNTFNLDNIEISPDAGIWLLVLDPSWSEYTRADEVKSTKCTDPACSSVVSLQDPSDTPADEQVGFLIYLGGGIFDDVYEGYDIPDSDTPVEGDLFKLYATKEGEVYSFWGTPKNLDLQTYGAELAQPLAHLGPFQPLEACDGDWLKCAYTGLYGTVGPLRVNEDCETTGGYTACGSFGFGPAGAAGIIANPVPLPAALPLFGSALLGIGLIGYRRRKVAR